MTDPVQSMLLEWLSSISKETYVRYLKKALTHIAAENNAVIVGRGANFVFGASSLNVRIVAPQDLRIAIFRAGNEMTKEEARRTIIARDRDRVNFVRNVFHSDIDNPQYYDLIVNLAAFTPESAAELIANAAKERCKLKQDECTEATLANHVRMMIHAKHHVRPEIVERYS
jgi:cytidylate kinase